MRFYLRMDVSGCRKRRMGHLADNLCGRLDADAYFGLDDLREWCVRQSSEIPIYLNKETYDVVADSFPYLVDKTKASGGGDM
jgi:hypothetical protein